ncbi:MAG: ATP-grasp domain-containing protein [Planctomycetota bacterium]|nr:ATP-grasp domain-containing protein [Planctomycetota bacterium]MDI6787371.1 ATP-grasp domain-containing protein [Planctomycetota bacterium]
MKVLVTDANNRVALSVVRALGESGVKVSSLEQEQFAHHRPLCFDSKYVGKRFIIPPIERGTRTIEKLLRYATGHDIILPVSINMLFAVVKNRTLFEKQGIRVPYHSLEQIRTANNKTELLKLAKDIQVPIPETYFITDLSEISALTSPSVGTVSPSSGRTCRVNFPLVIKLSDDEGLYLKPQKRYCIVSDKITAEKIYLKMHEIKPFPLIQEYIEGDIFGFSALLNKGKPMAFFCHKRLRQYPLSGGPSTLCEGIYDRTLIEQGMRLLKVLDWTGIAMVEFKKDTRDNQYKLMEINPRFWGSLPLAIRSGINFPYLLCQMAMQQPITPTLKYKIGEKTRFLFLDIGAVFVDKQTNLKIMINFFNDLLDSNIKDGIMDSADPRPALRYIRNRLGLRPLFRW